jgi:hypothetical protein
MPLIKIIATGGTIANTSHGLIGIDEVLKDIPRACAMADFEVTVYNRGDGLLSSCRRPYRKTSGRRRIPTQTR